jgi:hypothetical protein
MKGAPIVTAVLAALLILPPATIAGHPRELQETQAGDGQVIEVTAKKYEFTPEEIHVKKGGKVRLKVHHTDEEHGIKLNPYSEGSKGKSSPGLVFDDAQKTAKSKRAKTRSSISWPSEQGPTNSSARKCAGFTMAA